MRIAAPRVALFVLIAGALSGPALGQVGRDRAICCDSRGRLHSVECVPFPGAVTYRCWDGKAWSAEEVISQGYCPFNPAVVADSEDTIHVVFTDGAGSPDNADIFHTALKAGHWPEPKNITEAPDWDWGANMIALPNGEVHLCWQHTQGQFVEEGGGKGYRTSGVNPSLLHRVYKGGQWGEADTILDPGPTFGSLAADRKGTVMVAYTEGNPPSNTIALARYANGSWAPTETVGTAAGISPGGRVMLAIDADDCPHVAFTPIRNPKPAHCRKGPASWDGPTQLGGTGGFGADFGLCAAPDGSVHVAYADNPQGPGRPSLIHQCFKNGEWSPVSVVLKEAPQSFVMAAARDGTVHFVWGEHGAFFHAYGHDEAWQWGAGP